MRLKVNDIILDQFKETNIAQTLGVNEFGQLETRQGGFSNEFIIPLTSNNKIALDFPDDLNFVTRQPYEKVDAQLIDVGTVIAIGYLRYKIVTNDTQISCSFFSDNTEWFNLIKDKKMSDLDLSDYNHIWDYTNIAARINADPTEGYTYPLIDYGFFKDQDITSTFNIDSNQLFPAMFISTLVEQVYKDLGWSVTGTLLSEDRYQRMIQPFSAKDFGKSTKYISENTITDSASGNQVIPDPPAGTNVIWTNPTIPFFEFRVDIDGFYDYVFICNVTVTNHTIDFSLNSSFSIGGTGSLGANSVNVTGNGDYTIISSVTALNTLTSDSIFTFTSYPAAGVGNPTVTINSTTSISISPTPLFSVGENIIMSGTMPDMTQADFLRYIFFSFGVVPQPNNYSKTIDLDLFNNIEDNIPNSVDWSDKIDLSKTYSNDYTKLLNSYSRKSKLTYLEDEDDAELSAYTSETEQIFGQGFMDIDNEHLDPEKDVYESPYSSMINIVSFDGSVYIPQIKYYIEDPDAPGTFIKEFEPMPKIALISDNQPVSDLTFGVQPNVNIVNPLGAGVVILNDISFSWFAKTQYIPAIDSIDLSLAFDPVLFPNNIGSGLKETYIQNYVDILSNMKFIKAWFKLNEVDIANLDFMIPIYIDRFKSYFYINKIDNYQGSIKTTQVELIKIS